VAPGKPSNPSPALRGSRGNSSPMCPDITPEELQRRGDAADALWRELVRRATAKDRP